MLAYLVSFGVGLGVGALYALIRVASPAPPLIALAGLLGMVLGEQAIGMIRKPGTGMGRTAQAPIVSAVNPQPVRLDQEPDQ